MDAHDTWINQAPASARSDLRRVEALADLFDRKFLDPILGLVLPGVGDALGAVFGLYTVFVAYKSGLHAATIARMLINLGVDAVLGSVPLLGWIADFFYRPQLRNVALLRQRLEEKSLGHRRGRASDTLVLATAITFFLLALLLPVVLTVVFVSWLVQLF